MAELPDINTDNVTMIAYWNAISDGGVSSIDPEDATSDGNINSKTLYDNGVQVNDYSSPNSRTVQARVKSDGWIVAYIDTTEEYQQTVHSGPDGWWDYQYPLWNAFNHPNSPDNNLARVINNLRSQLDNSGSMTFNYSDVGLYNFEYTGATGVTAGSLNYDKDGTDDSAGFSYTSDTTLYAGVAIGAGEYTGGYGDYSEWEVDVEGNKFLDETYTDGSRESYGNYDMVGNGIIPNASTEYQIHHYVVTQDPDNTYCKSRFAILWG